MFYITRFAILKVHGGFKINIKKIDSKDYNKFKRSGYRRKVKRKYQNKILNINPTTSAFMLRNY